MSSSQEFLGWIIIDDMNSIVLVVSSTISDFSTVLRVCWVVNDILRNIMNIPVS